MNVYIAMTDQVAAAALRTELQALGYSVPSSWIDSPVYADGAGSLSEGERHSLARTAMVEIRNSSIFVAFSGDSKPSTAAPASTTAAAALGSQAHPVAEAATEHAEDHDLNAETDAAHKPAKPALFRPHDGGVNRHTELGAALAKGMPVAIIGGRENFFHSLTNVHVFADQAALLAWLPTAFKP